MPRSEPELKFEGPPKPFKHWPWILVGGIVLCLAMCTCCGGGIALYYYPRDPSPQFLVGTWRHEGWLQDTVYEFRADGTGRMTTNGRNDREFTYRLEGSRLTLDRPPINQQNRFNPFGGMLGPTHKRAWRSGGDLIIENDDNFPDRGVFNRVR